MREAGRDRKGMERGEREKEKWVAGMEGGGGEGGGGRGRRRKRGSRLPLPAEWVPDTSINTNDTMPTIRTFDKESFPTTCHGPNEHIIIPDVILQGGERYVDERERERERETHTHTHTHTQSERETPTVTFKNPDLPYPPNLDSLAGTDESTQLTPHCAPQSLPRTWARNPAPRQSVSTQLRSPWPVHAESQGDNSSARRLRVHDVTGRRQHEGTG